MESLAVSARAGKDQSASNSRPGPPNPTPTPDGAREAAKLRAEQHRRAMAHPHLSSTDRLVIDAMESYAYAKAVCWPSLGSIGKRIGLREKAVRLSVQNLTHYGLIRVELDGSIRTGRRYHLLWRTGQPIVEPDPAALSPRHRESARVARSQAKPRLGAPLRNAPELGAPLRNYTGAPLRNYAPELERIQEVKERSETQICDVENERGGNPDATPDGATRAAWDALPEDVRRSLDQSAKPSDGGADTPEAVAEPDRSEPTRGPADASEAFARLTTSTPPAAREQAARLIQIELGEADDAFMPAYRGIASEVAKGDPGGLTASAVAHALAEARKPRTRNRGKMFASTIGRCRVAGGMPPAPKLTGPSQAKPLPIPPTYRRDPFRNKATVIGGAVKAIEGRAADGLSPESNRAASLARASATCEAHGIDGESRSDYLEWVGEALAHVLDGAPLPNSAEYWRSAIRDIGRLPRRAAV